MKKTLKFSLALLVIALMLLLIFWIFPQIGLYTFLFDRGDYKGSYGGPTEVISDLDELTPKTKALCLEFIARCQAEGLDVKIVETYRTQERQDYLYSKGRDREGPIVTWTRNSKHTKRYAFDIAKAGDDPYGDEDFFLKCAEIGLEVGLTPGYYWSSFQDMPHYEYNAWWTP